MITDIIISLFSIKFVSKNLSTKNLNASISNKLSSLFPFAVIEFPLKKFSCLANFSSWFRF